MKRGKDFVGVGCGALLVNEQHEVLLLLRSETSSGGGGGLWAQPGGTVEFGETVKEAIQREIREEIGVEVEHFGEMCFVDDIREEEGSLVHWVTGNCFCRIVSGQVENREPEKHIQIKRFGLDEVPDSINAYTMSNIAAYKKHLGSISIRN